MPQGYIVQQKPQGIFFTEGPRELKDFRLKVSKFSLYCARERILRSKNVQEKCIDTDLAGRFPEILYFCMCVCVCVCVAILIIRACAFQRNLVV